MDSSRELELRGSCTSSRVNITLGKQLGFGNDGTIWQTNRKTAVKVERFAEGFERELAAYGRLKDRQVFAIHGFAIPRLLDYEDDLLVIEMEIVSAPYLLDFGKAYLDQRPDFTPEVLDDWQAERQELFEVTQWPTVKRVLASLASLGIFYYDAKPGNIQFLEEQDLEKSP